MGSRDDNTSKYIGRVQILVSINGKINYNGFVEAVCFRLGIDWSCNDVKIYMSNLTKSNDLSYMLKDDYDVWIMMKLSMALKKTSLFLDMVHAQ